MAEEQQKVGDGVLRLDTYSLGRAERTTTNGLRIPARLTRTGVFSYRLPDGSVRRELRTPDEVFKADSLASLKGAVLTDLHPRSGVVTSETFKHDAVGHVEGPTRDGRFVSADVVVQDAKVVDLVERGERREISCGYRCDLEHRSGEWEGEHYDAVQRNIIYNHAAIGPRGWGRAGSEVALRVDGVDVPCAFNDADVDVKTIRIDGKDYEVGSDSHFAKIDSLHAAEVAKLQSEIDALKKAADKEKGRTDSLESDLKKAKEDADPKRLDSLVEQRVAFLSAARAVLGDEYKVDGKSEREIMVDAIRADDKDYDDKGKSDDRVRGRFESLVEKGVRNDGVHSVVKRSAQFRADSADDEVSKARKARDERDANRWQAKPAAK